MCFEQRKEAVAHFLSLNCEPRLHAIQAAASKFGQSAEEVEAAVKAEAVLEFLLAIRAHDGPPRDAITPVARRYRLTDAELQAALDDHFESAEAL